ncbi:hypothetical protein ABGB12_26250 [Actinocorallia sp. B10E7]|uniref:hypothetical protein n=1 Tax=Actinocorallia sp. B10E7 TaxID=3153558 RepID=UPI00325DBCBA
MERAEIVVSKSLELDGLIRTGELLSRKGGMLTVRWDDDGREEQVRISSTTTFMPPGSLRHQAFVDPAALSRRLGEDPLALVVQLLRENGTRLKAPDIKSLLGGFGLDPADVDKAWRRVQSRLASLEEVAVSKAGYRWKPQRHHAPAPPAQDAPPAPEEEPTPAPSLLDSVLGSSSPAALREHLKTPLAVGVRLGRLSESELELLVESAPDGAEHAVRSLLLARPGHDQPLELVGGLSPADVDAVLTRAAAEIREDDSSQRSALFFLLTRALRLGALARTSPRTTVELLAPIALKTDLSKDDQALIADVLGVLQGVLRSASHEDRAAVDLRRLAAVAAALPFASGGTGRAPFLATVFKIWPAQRTDRVWWTGAAPSALNECEPQLRQVFEDPDVKDRVLAPLMAKEIADVATRPHLTRLLGLPAALVECLPPSEVAAALRRVSHTDPSLASWLNALD